MFGLILFLGLLGEGGFVDGLWENLIKIDLDLQFFRFGFVGLV